MGYKMKGFSMHQGTSPAKAFASAAQRKAVWASKNEKSPMKQKDPKAIEGKHYPSKETVKKLKKGPYTKGGQNANVAEAKKPKYPKNFNSTGSSKAGKFAKVAKKVVGKAAKFAGGKTLGVAGMLMSTSSKADQPKGKAKRKGSYTGDFTKLKSSPAKQVKDKKVKLKDAARTGVGQFADKAKKVLKEVFTPVSQQVKRNEKRSMEDFDKSMKSRMTPSEKAAYNKKYPNEKIK